MRDGADPRRTVLGVWGACEDAVYPVLWVRACGAYFLFEGVVGRAGGEGWWWGWVGVGVFGWVWVFVLWV